jgi:hypothetical protein
VQHVMTEYHELAGVSIPEDWTVSTLNPDDLLGASTLEFTGAGWTVNVHYQVVLEPVYDVTLEYDNDAGFTWEGKIDSDGTILGP